jgi:zinc protease
MTLDFFDYPDDYLGRYRDHIAAVTVADVQRAAREFINLARQQIVLVGDPQAFGKELVELGLPIVEVELDEPR